MAFYILCFPGVLFYTMLLHAFDIKPNESEAWLY